MVISRNKRRSIRQGRALLLCLVAALGCSLTQAQIRIGQTTGVTGPIAATVKETNEGAMMYIDAVNNRGGVNGQKIEWITLDDKFEPKLAAENARVLIEERGVIALTLNRGTPHTEAMLPLLEKYGVPLIAPSTGAMLLHDPIKKYVFNVRSTYQEEAAMAIRHQTSMGLTKIAVVHVDDSFGKDALAGAMKGFDAANLKPQLIEKFDRTKPGFSAIAPKLASEKTQAVMFVGSGQAVADGIKALRAAGSNAQAITLSNNASSGFIKLLGENARGVVVTQVLPGERYTANAFVREAKEHATGKGIKEVSPSMLEGFAAAKVVVEALRRTGSNPTREKLQRTLENFKAFDLGGGLVVNFSPTDHTGLRYTDLSIISAEGKFLR